MRPALQPFPAPGPGAYRVDRSFGGPGTSHPLGGTLRTFGRLLFVAAFVLSAAGCEWIVRASVDSGGVQANGNSYQPALSADGRFVAFMSDATNLVPGDTNGVVDVFVRDNRTGLIERIGNAAALGDISEDGRYVAYAANAPCGPGGSFLALFVRDRQLGVTECLAGSPDPYSAVLSATGQFVAFTASGAGLLVADRTTGQFDQIPVPAGHFIGGVRDLALSDDARFVAFTALRSSGEIGEGDVYVRDRQTDTTEQVPVPTGITDGFLINPSISADGRWVASELWQGSSPGPSYGRSVWAYDRLTGTSEALSVRPDGQVGQAYAPDISDDGRFVALIGNEQLTSGTPFGATYVRDRVEDRTTVVSRDANSSRQGGSYDHAIADDGRYVALTSGATNLVGNDTNAKLDVFVTAIPQVVVQSVSPNSVARGATATLTVTGDGFRPSPTVDAGTGVAVTSVTYVSEHELTILITAQNSAPTGARYVTVTNTGTGPGTAAGSSGLCGNCLTVT